MKLLDLVLTAYRTHRERRYFRSLDYALGPLLLLASRPHRSTPYALAAHLARAGMPLSEGAFSASLRLLTRAGFLRKAPGPCYTLTREGELRCDTILSRLTPKLAGFFLNADALWNVALAEDALRRYVDYPENIHLEGRLLEAVSRLGATSPTTIAAVLREVVPREADGGPSISHVWRLMARGAVHYNAAPSATFRDVQLWPVKAPLGSGSARDASFGPSP